MKEDKIKALAEYLDIGTDDVEDGFEDNNFEADGCEWLVLTDDEAAEAATEYIKESLWAFTAGFLAGETHLPESIFEALQPQCEGANEAILSLVEGMGDLDSLVESAISADGRGHFMSSYDGEENEQGKFFIYRTN